MLNLFVSFAWMLIAKANVHMKERRKAWFCLQLADIHFDGSRRYNIHLCIIDIPSLNQISQSKQQNCDKQRT